MLKFLAKNELINEKSVQEELDIKSSLIDFFSAKDPNTISEAINSTLAKTKSKKDAFYTKIIYYFSILINSKSFKIDSKAKTCIKNLIQICEPQVGSKIYQDLFYLFDNYQNELKKSVLSEIPLSKMTFQEDDFISLYALFIKYIIDDKNLNKNYDSDIVNTFAELIEKNKNYHLLEKFENIEDLRKIIREEMDENKDKIIGNINTSKLIFYLTSSSPDLVDEDLESYSLNEKLEKEKILIDDVENRNDKEILFNNEKDSYFKESYGEKGGELILRGAKETSIHEALVGFDDDKKKKISFKEFIYSFYEDDDDNENKKTVDFNDKEIQEKFEEIEDILISGKDRKLYNIYVDYLKKEIIILYIRRPQYEKEQKAMLLNKVKDMKAKLEIILKAIEKV